MKKCLFAVLALVALIGFTPVCRAADFTINWNCLVLDGSLSDGAFSEFSGSITVGDDTVHDVLANFVLPNATVGNGTGKAIGSIVIVCDVFAPTDGPAIEDITVDLLGTIVPGQFATQPFIAWTELIKDITDENNPVTLVSGSGVEYEQPSQRHYVFDRTTHAIRIKETFILDGVTYKDEQGRTQIDETAIASLTLVEKELSLVPEPGQLVGLGLALTTLVAIRTRRGR